MSRFVDGVGRLAAGAALATPLERVRSAPSSGEPKRPQALKRSAVAARLPRGKFDGIRRPVPPLNLQAPRLGVVAPSMAQAIETSEPPRPATREPEIRSPLIWRRLATAGAMAAVALLASGAAVRALATPKASTAHADRVATVASPAAPVSSGVTPVNTGLQALLDGFAASNPGKFGLYVVDLTSGEAGSVDADRPMTSASLYKLFVAAQILQRVDLGQAKLTSAAGSDTGQNIDGCLNLMITISDNACGAALGALLGWGEQDQALVVEGYHGTTLASPQKTSARDVGGLLERLYRGTLLSAASSSKFVSQLKAQHVNNRLPQGLPAGTVLAHKTGDLDGYVHDAGIVYGPTTNYLVVAMSGPWGSPGNAPAQFANLSSQLWHHFEP